MKTIGFIGLGNMGAPMARNLAAAGYKATCYDIAPTALAAAREAGLDTTGSAAEAAAGRDAVVTMLPDGAILLGVYREIVPAVAAKTVLLDCSTVDVASAREAHGMAAAAGLPSVDAPVSGGVAGAAAGTLTFMAGGTADAFAAVKPLFDVMGRNAFLCGPAGAGQATKICNNMILGISMIGVCEALNLAQGLGLDRQVVFDVVSNSSGSCWSMNTYCPAPGVGPRSPADDDYRPGFMAALMLKDLRLGQQAAAECGAATPLGAHATRLYEELVAAGGARKDFSAMIQHLAALARED